MKLNIEDVVPGGIKPTDRTHNQSNDGTCSRCRRQTADDEVPLMLWTNGGVDLLIYCNRCLSGKPPLDA